MTTHPRNPYLTVDVLVETTHGLVLIERAREPRGWALPGGFVDYGEDPADAARREVEEETGLTVVLSSLLGVYGHPQRDPRQHNVSIVYVGRAAGSPVGGDDAAQARVFAPDALPTPLCFDHAEILADYRWFKETGQRPPPPPRLRSAVLLAAARDAIEAAVTGRPPAPVAEEYAPWARQVRATFVTLRSAEGALRGCIGEISGIRSIAASVRKNAASAATEDTRFPPITPEEIRDLQIGVSVLTSPRQVSDPKDIVVGKHGIIVAQGALRGVFLPEVATQQGWDRETLLESACHKAGLPSDGWRAASTVISVFETLTLG